MFYSFVTKRVTHRQTDGHTDRIMIPKTALAQLLRTVKTVSGVQNIGGMFGTSVCGNLKSSMTLLSTVETLEKYSLSGTALLLLS